MIDLRSTCDSYKESPKKELMMKVQKIIKTDQEKKIVVVVSE
jgi:hypothetical protein